MKKLKREIPKNYSFLDLVAPSYNRVKITPKFVEGGGTPVTMTEPTMFMPPQSLNSGQPALLNSANEFDWNKQRLIDPGNALWNEHKKLYPNHKDGSKYHEYFLCNLNPDMCGGPNPKYRTLRTSENPEIQQLIKELDPLFAEHWKDTDRFYTLEKALDYRISSIYNRGIGDDIDKILKIYDKNITEDQKQKLKRLYTLSLQDSGNEIVKNPNPTNFYNEYLVNWKSPSQWNYQNKAAKFYNDQEAFATGMDAWNNRNLNTDTVPNIQAPVVNTPTPITPKVNPINLPQMQFPNMQSSNLEPIDDTRNASLRDFNPFGTPQITPQVPNTINKSKTVFPTLTSNVTSNLNQPSYTDVDWMTNMFGQEGKRGGFDINTGKSFGLSNFGYNTPLGYKLDNDQNSPTYGKIISKKDGSLYNNTGVFDDAPKNINEAIARYSKEYLPLVSNLPLGLRERAGHFLYNTSRDPRVYMLKSYLDSKGTPWTNEQRKSLNRDIFSSDWTPETQKFFNEQWDANKAAIEALPVDQQVDLLNQGKDFYYQNINRGKGESNENLRAYNATHKAMIKDWYDNLPYYQQPSISKNTAVQTSPLINPSDSISSSFISPLNPNYKPSVTSGFSMTNPYDSNNSYAGDWLSKFKERERNNNPELSQDEIDRITAEEEQGQLNMGNLAGSNYGYTGSTLKLNDPIQTNGIANLPKQNQWDNLIEPLPVQRPSEYADPQQAIIGSIKTDFKPADEDDSTSSYKPYAFNPFTTGLNILNTGLNTIGGMRNMSRMRNQENLNSFITQQPEAIYPNKRMLYGDKSMFAEYGGEYSHGGMYPDGGSVYDPDAYVGQLVQYKKGGIYIKPENKGKFTAWAQSHGMSVQEAASHVMANKEKYSSTTVKRANFAKNASKWKKEKGGEIDNDKEMVDGVADILSRVNDVENRKELARYMTNQFNDENVDYDYDQFLAATNLMEMAYGGHYIPQDVNYIGGRFIPNRVDLQEFKKGGMIKRADGSYSQRGLWDNIRANKGSGKKPTKEMLKQERKIKMEKKEYGGSKNINLSKDNVRVAPQNIRYFPKDQQFAPQPSIKSGAERLLAAGSLTLPFPANYVSSILGSGIDFYDAYNENDPQVKGALLAEAALGLVPFGKSINGFKVMSKAMDVKDIINPSNEVYRTSKPVVKNLAKKESQKSYDVYHSKDDKYVTINGSKMTKKDFNDKFFPANPKAKYNHHVYKAGGEYMEGNEYEISGEELERLRSLGYDIEMI